MGYRGQDEGEVMEIYTVEQAAEKLKLRPSTILRHIRKGSYRPGGLDIWDTG